MDVKSLQINYQGQIVEQTNSFLHAPSSFESQIQSAGIQQEIQATQIRNMSQSSGAPGGFRVNKAQINDRLQLLKSTFKYKNQSDQESRSNIGEFVGVGQRLNFESAEKRMQFEDFSIGEIKQKAISEYNPRQITKLPAVVQNNNNFMMQQINESGLGETGIVSENHAQQTHNSFGLSNVSTNLYHNNLATKNNNKLNFKGPIKAISTIKSHQDYLNTIQQDNTYNQPVKISSKYQQQQEEIITSSYTKTNSSKVSEQRKQQIQNDQNKQISLSQKKSANESTNKKPPVNTNKYQLPLSLNKQPTNETFKNEYKDNLETPTKSRIFNSSESISNYKNTNYSANIYQNDISSQMDSNQQTSTHYNAPDEPLYNPESQFKLSVSNLNSQDWQKVFEALNIVKRVALFHKDLLSMTEGNYLSKECFKNIVKQTENLRSQVAKNACMTLQVIYSELPTKDLDSNLDLVISALIKKSTDTNHFVSEQAEKALKMVCHACTESKVLNCLSSIEGRSNIFKQKITLAYNYLIEKLGLKIKDFKEIGKLLRCLANMLNEGALEVRNQAKIAIIQIKNMIQNKREFDVLLIRSGLPDKQIEQVRKVVEQSDLMNVTNVSNQTRYGGIVRGSSLDSRLPSTQAQGFNMNDNFEFKQEGFNQNDQKLFDIKKAGQNDNSTYSQTQQSNQKRTMVKQVDPLLLEELKTIVQQSCVNDWNARLKSIETLNNYIKANGKIIQNGPPSKFIQILDIQCVLIQDNNSKVQLKAIQNFKDFLTNEQVKVLIEQNLTIIIQAIAINLQSSQPSIRTQNEQILNILEETIDNKSQLIPPLVSLINLQTTKCKVQLVQKLADLVLKIQQSALKDKYFQPLLNQNNKIWAEANLNPKLKEALKNLAVQCQIDQL